MGAIASYGEYKAATKGGQRYIVSTAYVTPGNPQLGFHSSYLAAGGLAPSVSVACNSDTPGALLSVQRLKQTSAQLWPVVVDIIQVVPGSNGVIYGGFLLADRLVHHGGLSGAVAGVQTTNLPTAPLPRYTNGVGVMLGIEVYSNVGTTQVALTASYTNTNDVSGRTTYGMPFSSSVVPAGNLIILPLKDGDVGVKSVESVTLSDTTGTAGNFGVTLFKPIMFVPQPAVGGTEPGYCEGLACGRMAPIENDACLMAITRQPGNFSFAYQGTITLLEK